MPGTDGPQLADYHIAADEIIHSFLAFCGTADDGATSDELEDLLGPDIDGRVLEVMGDSGSVPSAGSDGAC